VKASAKEKAKLTGRKKAAILMVSLGSEVAAEVYKNLTDDEIEQITIEVATLGAMDPRAVNEVIEEFYHTAVAQEQMSQGGVALAKDILERALGPVRAMEIIGRLQGALTVSPFDFLKRVDPNHLLSFIQNEHPQTIALILAHLDFEKSASIMSALSAELQSEVSMRIATMDQTSPEIIAEVERVLERKIATVLAQEFTVVGGVEALAEVLNRCDRSTEKLILETLEEEDQELAEEIKKLMFVFEDIILLDDRGIQQILKEVDQKELAIALKGASEEVGDKVFGNMSKRAADMIKEDMEFMGPVRLRNVEEAQQRIVSVVRRLEEAGEIIISRGGEEEMVV